METVSIANPVKPRPWPLPPIFQEPSADPVATGLRIANAIRYAVYGPHTLPPQVSKDVPHADH
jgi:hypothetical protein